MSILIFYAKVKLFDGSFATGPVTTPDYHEFLFKNTGSDLDLYFSLKKNNGDWNFSNGIQVPPSYIEQVGNQIDQQLVVK